MLQQTDLTISEKLKEKAEMLKSLSRDNIIGQLNNMLK